MSVTADPAGLFTRKHAAYDRFIHVVRYPQGIRSFFLRSSFLHDGLRVLDADCGTGVISIALHDALIQRSMPADTLHAFDLTPAMLEHFASKLEARGRPIVEMRKADVLKLTTLPESWCDYDLIVTASMLEYVPREQLPIALANLRLRREGTLVLFTTKRNWLMRPLVDVWWRSNLYDRDQLRSAFQRAGFREVEFVGFPREASYLWGHIVVARA